MLSLPDYVEQEQQSRAAPAERDAVLIRANERRPWAGAPAVAATYQELTPARLASMLVLDVRMGQGPTFANEVRHGGDENLVCLSGRFELVVEGNKHVLGPGDSVFIPRGKRHCITTAFEAAEAVYAICPGRYESTG